MRATLALLAALSVPVFAQTPAPGAETADWVARQMHEQNRGRDGRLRMTMRLFDRHRRSRERSLVMSSLTGVGGAGDRELVRFLNPGDIKGTGLLVWEHPDGEDERFLFLPALGRVRRIAGSEKQESFVGSDLSYDDIGGRELEDYRYRFAQRDASWTAPGGERHAAWQLESIAKDPDATYPRSVSLVRKDNFVLVAADIFNRRNEREKQYDVRRLERIDGIWTVMDVTMANDLLETRTELIVTEARYNVGLTEADFTRRVLEQVSR
jgi:hypothetical protein